MSDGLFFLPMIADALRQRDPRTAMRAAFEQIRTMGQEPRYQAGYHQFLQLMDAVDASLRGDAPEEIGARLLDEMDRPTSIELVLERQYTPVARCTFDQPAGTRNLRGIAPGPYRLRTDTGLVLWEGTLTEREVIWGRAFPDQDFPLAADTGDLPWKPTLELELLNGTLCFRVFPGFESGSVKITLTSLGAR